MGIETTQQDAAVASDGPEHGSTAGAASGPAIPSLEEARKRAILNRLRRLEGQVRGLHRMVDEDRTCQEVLTLLSGVRSALDATADAVLELYLETCSTSLTGSTDDVKELLEAVRLARG